MKKRIFVAIKASPYLEGKIVSWQERHQHLPLRWLKPKNLHITLVPPWYENDVESVMGSLQPLSSFEPFEILFNEIAAGPSTKSPRLIWVSAESSPKLEELKTSAEKSVNHYNEYNKYTPHITIGRARGNAVTRDIMIEKQKVEWPEKVSSIVLMESILEKGGAEYEILGEVKFKTQ